MDQARRFFLFGGRGWPEDPPQIVEKCRMFAGLEPRRLGRLQAMAQRRWYKGGTMIFSQGEDCPGIYIVGMGQVRIYNIATGGKEHVLHLAGPGATFAEVAAIGDFPCPAWAEAMEETTCALLPAVELSLTIGPRARMITKAECRTQKAEVGKANIEY